MQTAPGETLSSTAGQPRRPSRHRTLARWGFLATAIPFYAIDQGSKEWALRSLEPGVDVPLLGDWFGLHLTRNPGAAFSAATGYTPVLTCIAILASAVILYLLVRRVADRAWGLILGLLFAGVLGNLTDRLLRDPGPMRGHVVDLLRLPNWPIFNFADVWINIAAVLIVVQTFRGIRLDGTKDTA